MHSTLYICRQQIRLKHTSELVLLCSNYCITPPKDQTETMTLCQTDTRSKDSREVVRVIHGVWKCPCVSGQLQSSELFGYKYYGQLRLLKISCSHPDNTNNIIGPVTDRSVCCRARLLPHYLSRSPESRYSRTIFKQGDGHRIQLIFEHLKNLSIFITYDKSLEFNFTNFLVRKRLRRR